MATGDLDILYRDNDLVVVNKPSGLITHRSAGCSDDTSCLSRLRRQLGVWLYPVHRLDRATSGALAFALHVDSARALAAAFADGGVKKTYLAVTRGHWQATTGVIDRPLRRLAMGHKTPRPPAEGLPLVAEPLQEARTTYQVLAAAELPWSTGRFPSTRWSLLAMTPETGRRHQLRRHAAGLSHPIIGDTTYGDGAHNRQLGLQFGLRRLLLHAFRLRLPRAGGEDLAIEAPVDQDFVRVLGLFGSHPQWTATLRTNAHGSARPP